MYTERQTDIQTDSGRDEMRGKWTCRRREKKDKRQKYSEEKIGESERGKREKER